MALRTATVTLNINATANIESAGDAGSAQTSLNPTTNYQTAGTADGQADTSFTHTYSVTTTPTTIDLSSGTITQPDGTIATFADITTLFIANGGTAGTVTVGGGSNPVANIAGVIGFGGYMVWHNPQTGYPVTPGTGDILTLTASAGSISTKVLILGRSA
jgi:hypothetical protein